MWHVRDVSKTGADVGKDKESGIEAVKEASSDWTKDHPLATKILVTVVSITVTYVTKWVLGKIDARKKTED